MNANPTVEHGRTAKKHWIRGLAVLAVLTTAVIATVDTTSALDAQVSTDLVRSTPRQHVEGTAAGGRMILR